MTAPSGDHKQKPRQIRAGSVQQVQQIKNDDITISEFGEAADDVMTEMTAAGCYGMTAAQAEIVARMTRLLDKAAKIINGVIEGGESGKLISKAANHALSMRIYGATLRGIAGAELLEDLCDAAIGRHLQAVAAAALAAKAKTDIENSMTVEEAMTMLDCRSYAAFSDILDCSLTTVKNWRSRGRVPADWAEKVRSIYRGMKVRAAA